jgi:replicative DNA helicase
MNSCKAQGKAEEMGGLSYLNATGPVRAQRGNIRRYAEIVREKLDSAQIGVGQR